MTFFLWKIDVREKHPLVGWPGLEPTTWVCTLTGNWTYIFWCTWWCSNQQSHMARAKTHFFCNNSIAFLLIQQVLCALNYDCLCVEPFPPIDVKLCRLKILFNAPLNPQEGLASCLAYVTGVTSIDRYIWHMFHVFRPQVKLFLKALVSGMSPVECRLCANEWFHINAFLIVFPFFSLVNALGP